MFKLPRLTATFRVTGENPFPDCETFSLYRYQNPRETQEAALVKLCADASRKVAMRRAGCRAKLLAWKLK